MFALIRALFLGFLAYFLIRWIAGPDTYFWERSYGSIGFMCAAMGLFTFFVPT